MWEVYQGAAQIEKHVKKCKSTWYRRQSNDRKFRSSCRLMITDLTSSSTASLDLVQIKDKYERCELALRHPVERQMSSRLDT